MNPFPLPDATALSAAWALRPDLSALHATFDLVEAANGAAGCPSLKLGECNIQTWTGCEAGGVVSEGTATLDECIDGSYGSWDGFSASWKAAGWSFAVDGSYSAYAAGNLSVSLHTVLLADSICESVSCSGLFDWNVQYDDDGSERTSTARVAAEPASGTAGDFCIDEALVETEACEDELVGWTVVRGEQAAMVVWDGDVACDGCGALYVDGVPSGTWCRSDWTAF